ncbi:hypothetical protein KAR91_15790, partial [Candidatus Pacearchaeota archaeon]|nr:hypothetical protein [Candidatus Pacearchaeota archaeon]
LLKGFEEYGTEGVVLYGGADFLIVEFSMGKDVCYMYCSYYENRDPLNFRNACDDHLHSGWMKEMVPVNKKVVQAFQRTLLMLPDKLLPLVQVYIDQKMGYKITTVNQQRGQLVDYIQTTKKEKLPTKYGDITFYMDVSSALNALEHCDKLLFTQDCSIFSCQNYVQLVINRSEPIVAQDNLG